MELQIMKIPSEMEVVPVLKINNHATGGWRTKDILGGPKSLETKKLDGTRWGQGGTFCEAKF